MHRAVMLVIKISNILYESILAISEKCSLRKISLLRGMQYSCLTAHAYKVSERKSLACNLSQIVLRIVILTILPIASKISTDWRSDPSHVET